MKKEGQAPGSLCKIELIATDLVSTMPDEPNGILLGQVQLKAGAAWQEIYFTQDSAHFVEQPNVVDGAEVYEMIVKWSVPKDNAVNLRYILTESKKRHIARLTKLNGGVLIAGKQDEGCRLMLDMRDAGKEATDKDHYIVALRLTRIKRVPHAAA